MSQPQTAPITLLQRRRIEAEILKPVYEVLKERLGPEEAKTVLGAAIQKVAREGARKLAQEMGGGTLAKLIDLQPLWRRDEALKVTVLKEDAHNFDYNVTRCAYAAMYRDLGLGDLGFFLSCLRDGAFIEGFAPDIELTRTQTLMEGASHCDFRYRVK
ncbi:MAG: L-2-amino-thiazoline-4-carboxylic acid hydrolase [Deltaproteobacteria bacterium]|jgi:predicted hydrocarbon binding protein|nr:L-2-amino-thiazoline-4-carboxylic acid hydrolase [Deltaproteobacteria bacterium]